MRKHFYHSYKLAPEKWGSRTLELSGAESSFFERWRESSEMDLCDAMMMCTFMNFREKNLNKSKS